MEIDLKPFCSTDISRYHISAPWTEGEHTFASDGVMVIRVPKREEYPGLENHPVNVQAYVFEPQPSDGKFFDVSLLAIPEPMRKPCKKCEGKGKFARCAKCYGMGYKTCDLGHDHDCRECGGKGYKPLEDAAANENAVECNECDGVGTIEETVTMKIGEETVNAQYVRLIATLPNAKIAQGKEYNTALTFTFDGGEGRLIPMKF